MCFSASVSFGMGGALVGVGIASISIANKSNKKWLPLSFIPLLSGIQQIIEGLIWLKLSSGQQALAEFYSYFYLFFAYSLWPVYIPYCAQRLEPNPRRKKWMSLFVVSGLLLSIAIYVPVLMGSISLTVVQNSFCKFKMA